MMLKNNTHLKWMKSFTKQIWLKDLGGYDSEKTVAKKNVLGGI